MNVPAGMIFVLAALALLVGLTSHLRARGWFSPETSRKVVHVGMGLVCLTFPWVFTTVVPVLEIGVIAAIVLGLIRAVPYLRRQFGCSLHDIPRTSHGEFAFIAGISAAFALSEGHRMAYLIAVAVLVIADTAAAAIGQKIGRHRYYVVDGAKTVEGSFAFFVTSVACIAIPLVLLGVGAALPVALLSGITLTMLEATLSGGLDNIAIPIAAVILMRALA